MMKNRLLVEILIIFVMFNIWFLNTSYSSQPKIYDVSKVAVDQLKYKGVIGVAGKVISTYANGTFILGSSEGAVLTVRYAGDQPTVKLSHSEKLNEITEKHFYKLKNGNKSQNLSQSAEPEEEINITRVVIK